MRCLHGALTICLIHTFLSTDAQSAAVRPLDDRADYISAATHHGPDSMVQLPTQPAMLSRADVLTIAHQHNPDLDRFAAEYDLARAAITEAVARINTEIEGGVTLAGDDRDLEYDIELRQTIEHPERRRTRYNAARAGQAVAAGDRSVFESTLRADVVNAYWAVAYHTAVTQRSHQSIENSERIQAIIGNRIRNGAARPAERIRTDLAVINARRTALAAQRRLAVARNRLNALCGRALPDDYALSETLQTQFAAVDAVGVAETAQAHHPALQRLRAVQHQRLMAVESETAKRHPDLVPGIGIEKEDGEHSFTVRLGMALPFRNKNEFGIARAHAELDKVDAEIRSVTQNLIGEIDLAVENYSGAVEQLKVIEESQTSAATLRASASFLFEQGEHDRIALLEVEQTVQQLALEHLAARYDAQIWLGRIEQLTGYSGGDK